MKTALIVGAGIGGLAAGIMLRRSGWRVRIFERGVNPRELGFALNLAPDAIAALREQDGVEVTLRDGRSERGDVLVGADGVGSVVRRTLHPAEPPAKVSRYVAALGVSSDAAEAMKELSAVAYFGDGLEAATVRAGGGRDPHRELR